MKRNSKDKMDRKTAIIITILATLFIAIFVGWLFYSPPPPEVEPDIHCTLPSIISYGTKDDVDIKCEVYNEISVEICFNINYSNNLEISSNVVCDRARNVWNYYLAYPSFSILNYDPSLGNFWINFSSDYTNECRYYEFVDSKNSFEFIRNC